jgi:DNA polymerase-3 subunit delta
MRLQFDQLADSLRRQPAPVYLICGEEPLQLGEAAGMIRRAAQERGFQEREVLTADGAFDWERLRLATQSMSLFASRKLIELRLQSARIGREGGAAVRAYCDAPPPENLLLIVAPGLEYKELNAGWVRAVEQRGALLQVRRLVGPRLVEWIDRRLRERGLEPAPGVSAMLAERVEGNLLAANQEVEKLSLLLGRGTLDAEQLIRAISDSSRFDIFDFTGAALAGHRARMHRVLAGLAAEGTPAPLVLWALARELRLLARAAFAAGGRGLEAFFASERVWESRRAPLRSALKRLAGADLQALLAGCEKADRQIKGLAAGDPWLTLAELGDALSAPRVGSGRPPRG